MLPDTITAPRHNHDLLVPVICVVGPVIGDAFAQPVANVVGQAQVQQGLDCLKLFRVTS